MVGLPPHARAWAIALIAAVVPHEIALAEPPEVIVSEIGAERIVDLMFPEGTPFERAPVIKWDHEPKIMVLIEDNVDETAISEIKQELATLRERLRIKSLDISILEDASAQLPTGLDAFEIVVVVGHKAVERSRERYWPLLTSAIDDQNEASKFASTSIERKVPAIHRFRGPLDTGVLTRVVAMIRVGGAVADSRPLVSTILYTSLCPSIGAHGRDPRLFQPGKFGAELTEEAFAYQDFLYGEVTPVGMDKALLQKLLGLAQ